MLSYPVRAVQGAPVTVRFTPFDSDGESSTSDPGTVTVGVVRADGTVVVAAGTATTSDGASRTYTLTAAQTALLDVLTVTWTAGGVIVGTSTVEVVGSVLATVAEVRGIEDSTSDIGDYQTSDILRARTEVDAIFERACGGVLSFVPRYTLATVYAATWNGTLDVPHYFLRAVRSVSYVNVDGGVSPVDLTSGVDLSAGIRLNGYRWPCGRLLVGYEHGMDAPPPDVKRAAIAAIRRQLNLSRSGVEARAMSYTSPLGEVQRFPTPGLGPWVTGVPDIDAVLIDYRKKFPVVMVG